MKNDKLRQKSHIINTHTEYNLRNRFLFLTEYYEA